MADTQTVRVRIAPSPTGDPHVGTAYIALFNLVFARKHGGQFVLRVEDTDQTRARASSEQQIYDSLKWLGLNWDEGPDCGGPYGPYRQSERTAIYREHVDTLINKGAAYRCFCTADRLNDMRKQQREAGQTTRYDGHCRNLDDAKIKQQLADQVPYVVRLAMPQGGQTIVKDALRGEVSFENERIDDQVLLKSDGFPTYHLANVVDDHLMKISHVIRAEEWINSTPKHVQLYKAFGWDEPVFVHMPLLRNSDKSKISKRKNPTSLFFYQRAGILPDALRNFLGLMSWSMGGDQEVFTFDEMVEAFDFKGISLGGPVFDQDKLNWLNQQYMQKLDPDAIVTYLREQLFTADYLASMVPLVRERLERFDQFVDRNGFFFNGPLEYGDLPLVPKGKKPKEMREMFRDLAELYDACDDWDAEIVQSTMDAHKDKIEFKPRDYFMPVRLAVTGRKDSPPLAETMAVLGREIVRFRLRDAAAKVN